MKLPWMFIAFVVGTAFGRSLSAQRLPAAFASLNKARDSVVASPLRGVDGEPVALDYSFRTAIQSSGNVLINDMHDSRIIMFDVNGKFLAAAGRKGSGPGEFQSRSSLLRLRADSTLSTRRSISAKPTPVRSEIHLQCRVVIEFSLYRFFEQPTDMAKVAS